LNDLNRTRRGTLRKLREALAGPDRAKVKPKPLQSDLLALLLQAHPAIKTQAWRRTVYDAFKGSEEVAWQEEDFHDALLALNLLPDAYAVYPETMELHFFEVEVTHLLSREKMEAYAVFLTNMDYYGIEFAVFTVNQHGHINQVPLLHSYIDWLKDRMTESPASCLQARLSASCADWN
jgi:hypothetical protein